jgi:hypothetical protein
VVRILLLPLPAAIHAFLWLK